MQDSISSEKFYIVRTYSAGVFAGKIVKKEGNEVEMTCARRIWYLGGAASLSELATRGTCKPSECKFPVEVDKVILMNVIEILECTTSARKSIESVPVWSATS